MTVAADDLIIQSLGRIYPLQFLDGIILNCRYRNELTCWLFYWLSIEGDSVITTTLLLLFLCSFLIQTHWTRVRLCLLRCWRVNGDDEVAQNLRGMTGRWMSSIKCWALAWHACQVTTYMCLTNPLECQKHYRDQKNDNEFNKQTLAKYKLREYFIGLSFNFTSTITVAVRQQRCWLELYYVEH